MCQRGAQHATAFGERSLEFAEVLSGGPLVIRHQFAELVVFAPVQPDDGGEVGELFFGSNYSVAPAKGCVGQAKRG